MAKAQRNFPVAGTPIAGDIQPNMDWLNFFRQLGRLLVSNVNIGDLPCFADALGAMQDSGVNANNGCIELTPQAQPSSGVVGQVYVSLTGVPRICTSAGTPGVWTEIGGLGSPGDIKMCCGTTPVGWLACDGSSVSQTTYAALYAVIGTTFGNPGGGNFNLPDFRGIFPKGAGTTTRTAGKDASGNAYAATLGTYSTDQMQGHKHLGRVTANAAPGGAGATEWGSSFTPSATDDVVTTPRDDGTNGTPRTGHTSEPQSLGVNFVIKT